MPNDTLTPEHSLSLDTGIKLERMGVRAETFLFYIRHEDAILLAPTTVDGQAQTPAGDRYYASFNAASVTQFGIESAWRVSLSPRIGVFAVGLAVLGNQRNPKELDLPGKTPADRVPPPQGTVGLWAEALDDVHVEVFASGAASQDRLNIPTNVDDNRIPEEGTPGYVTFHGRLAWTASRQLTARLALDNVTDQLVLEHGSGYYAPGFNAMLGVDFVLE